jgi:3-hydroxyacyl-CoA dehydrogenase
MAHQPTAINRATVVGAGTMGSGIAQVLATAGLHVTLVDVEPRQLERARAAIESSLARLVQRGTITAEQRAGALAGIRTTPQLDAPALSAAEGPRAHRCGWADAVVVVRFTPFRASNSF